MVMCPRITKPTNKEHRNLTNLEWSFIDSGTYTNISTTMKEVLISVHNCLEIN